MPPQRRTIFALSRQENLSRQEIADGWGVSVRTVDKHLELALSEIRLRIKDFQWVLLRSCSVKERQRGCFRERMQNRIRPDDAANFSSPALRSLGQSAKKRGDHRSPRPLKQTFRHFPKTSFSTAANR